MTEQITPPPELAAKWVHEIYGNTVQELEACCDWMSECTVGCSNELRAARRTKPPSLKEQGLQALEALQQRTTDPNIVEPLRRALEALPDD